MEFKQLEAFVNVVELNSFSKAAQKLFLSQPTISGQIKSLEDELNVELFIRTTKKMYISEDGKKFYKYAKEIIDMKNKALEAFNKQQCDNNEITLAASTMSAQYILPEVLFAFNEKNPNNYFSVIRGDSNEVIEKVAGNEVEIGVVGKKIENTNCVYEEIYKDKLVIITPNNSKYRRIKENGVSLDDLLKEPIIMRECRPEDQKEAAIFLENINFDINKLNVIGRINDQETIKKSVSSGIGISIMSKKATEDFEMFGKILTFDICNQKRYKKIFVVYRQNRQLSLTGRKFIKFIKNFYNNSDK
ncbi:selenium metabolism-associated LysR family transcriptional regulator [Clostridium sp.]|uniref:selenium metabolism-associated LysR family transcriptional regulator n=1 Tax=Clostridium sp. TaxID=1506 RepID=UPI002636B1B8|nr:selenium metabolism-associated LysR family transcriptional regulator [Clostridium sp.]